MTDEPLLSLRNLTVEFPIRKKVLRPVDNVTLDIGRGEILGVVGESGAGKSMTGNAVIGLIDPPGHIAGGEVLLGGERIDNLPAEAMRRVRGKRIGMVFQDPLTSLNPLLRIGDQIVETIQTHLGFSRDAARAAAIRSLDEVGIPAAARRIDSYPHEFSGGMRQRVVIALALAAEPELIIADEPTTALDVSVQAQVLGVLKAICRERQASVMLITHDMGVIAETTDRVAVMYAGRLVEIGATREVLSNPRHPYTEGLMLSTPSAASTADRLRQIPGSMPGLLSIPGGCAFNPRCDRVFDRCRGERPDLKATDNSHIACWLAEPGEDAA